MEQEDIVDKNTQEEFFLFRGKKKKKGRQKKSNLSKWDIL
ncbi:hypothetical protein IGI49_004587 [Enterococcus sp. AZ071]